MKERIREKKRVVISPPPPHPSPVKWTLSLLVLCGLYCFYTIIMLQESRHALFIPSLVLWTVLVGLLLFCTGQKISILHQCLNAESLPVILNVC